MPCSHASLFVFILWMLFFITLFYQLLPCLFCFHYLVILPRSIDHSVLFSSLTGTYNSPYHVQCMQGNFWGNYSNKIKFDDTLLSFPSPILPSKLLKNSREYFHRAPLNADYCTWIRVPHLACTTTFPSSGSGKRTWGMWAVTSVEGLACKCLTGCLQYNTLSY